MKWEQTPEGKEWAKGYHHKYYLANKEKYSKYYRKYFSNPEVRARKNEQDRNRVFEVKKIIYDVLGGAVCKNCGFDDIRALQLDHINGGGSKDKQTNRGTVKILRLYRNNLEKLKQVYQILCANCNWIKKHENNEG